MSEEKNTWRSKIACAILEKGTFDLDEDEGGYPTIHYLIAGHMLKDFNEYMRVTNLPHYAGMVARNLDNACVLLEDLGYTVYRVVEYKRRNISCVTLDPAYRNAKEKEAVKVVTRANRAIDLATDRLRMISEEQRIAALPQRLTPALNNESGSDANQLPPSPPKLPITNSHERHL